MAESDLAVSVQLRRLANANKAEKSEQNSKILDWLNYLKKTGVNNPLNVQKNFDKENIITVILLKKGIRRERK